MKILAFVIFAFLTLCLVSGFYVFVVACIRRKELPWLVEDEIKNTSYGKYAKNIQNANRWLLEHNAEDVFISSDEGLRLHGFWVEAEKPRGTVLFAHGYRSTMLVDFGLAFDLYYNLGMNLLIPEQRCHGMSKGCYITFGVKESRDMQAWIDFHNRTNANLPVLLSGLSMGASTMLFLADRDLPENVKGIIADCGFTSPKDIISHVFRKVTHLPAGPSLLVTEFLTRVFAGFSLSQCDTRRSLLNSKLPVLLVHGTADDFVPCEMTKQAYDACTSPKKLFLVEGASHGVSFLIEQKKYTDMVGEFLNTYIL